MLFRSQEKGKTISIHLVTKTQVHTFFSSKQTTLSPSSLFDTLLKQGIYRHATDIHVFSQANGASVWLRIRGQLYLETHLDHEKAAQLTKLIKLKAGLDIALLQQAQDGRFSFNDNGAHIDVRVSTLPTTHAEDLVLRLLNPNSTPMQLDTLGFSDTQQQEINAMLKKKSGLILVTGPTGSGKSTTLYACLRAMQRHKKQVIVTLEDPVECIVAGTRQSQINPASGHTFDRALRAVLRQDPDCIMIGEIRDKETAKLALEAAYTGHLVLSSIHTSTVENTLIRLLSFQCDPFLMTHCLKGIISQRLAPVSCKLCAPSQATHLPNGCNHCNFTGISSRALISELLHFNRKPSTLYGQKTLDLAFLEQRFISFRDDIASKSKQSPILELHIDDF